MGRHVLASLRRTVVTTPRQAGFGLVELLCALTLLAIAVFAVIGLFQSGMLQLRRASTVATAATLADAEMEKFREIKHDALGLSDAAVLAADATYKGDAAYRADTAPQTALAAPVDLASTSVTVASAAGFPTLAPYRVAVGGEVMLVTAGAGTTQWTVTRGLDGTTAGVHSAGATVTQKQRVAVPACGSPPCTTLVPTSVVTGADGRSYRVDRYASWQTVTTTGSTTGRQVKLMTLVVRDGVTPSRIWARLSSSFDEATGR